MLIKNIEYELSFLSAIFIIGRKKKTFSYLPTYLPIGQIVESERGNKQYFNEVPLFRN
jgi:hypothetical protein